MHDVHILADFLLILALSVVVVWVFHKLKLPALVGFLGAGVLIGPGGFGFIQSSTTIDLLAEIGIVLLLFSIGLEFSFKDLVRIRRMVVGGGGLQLGITAAVAGLVTYLIGFDVNVAILWGALIGLSSTAIVLNLLQKSGELNAVHGQGMLGILLFQDMAVVGLILLVPILGGEAMGPVDIGLVFAKAIAVVVALWIVASYIYPKILERIVRTRQRELFTLVTILAAVGTAYLAGLAGLSLALGAFLGGLVISESPYSHHMLSEVLPFRDLFNAVFFVSVGMLFKPTPFLEAPGMVIGLIAGALVLKAVIAAGVIVVLGYGLRVGVLVGLGVAQVGEFSFILAKEAMEFDLLDPDSYSIFLAVSLVTMGATPLLFRVSDWLATRVEEAGSSRLEPLLAPTRHIDEAGTEEERPTEDHVIIVGYGLNGRNVARVLRRIEVPYVIVEMNSRTVRDLRGEEPIYFGDAARQPILEHLGVKQAHALVVAIGDAPTTRRIVALARQMNPELYLVVRTRYAREVDTLAELGASEVIPEEFETSLALVGAVLE
ncbi:MAG: cation:proton antiporter, partial [Persicimonas sp.]